MIRNEVQDPKVALPETVGRDGCHKTRFLWLFDGLAIKIKLLWNNSTMIYKNETKAKGPQKGKRSSS